MPALQKNAQRFMSRNGHVAGRHDCGYGKSMSLERYRGFQYDFCPMQLGIS
jgi:hypothetical protein